MDTQKQQIVDRLKQANNILVTVSSSPSVDQLAACIGLTLALNKMKKHATAVFSGAVPPIIEFLQPEKTLERTTDSLRDFIIALDKAKADKLRYKVEDKFVKIFITPYRTSISQKDLEFSEGDFNVDVVLALGVHKQTDLDQAITAHGRILHDAAVISINTQPNVELGSINLLDPQASSLSEIAVELLNLLDKQLMDSQIATAFLTGVVAETDRFRNNKTTPTTMSISAELLSAGANQQLVASKLDAPPPPPPPPPLPPQAPPKEDAHKSSTDGSDVGVLKIDHDESPPPPPPPLNANKAPDVPQIHIDDEGRVQPLAIERAAIPKTPPSPPQSSLPPYQPPKVPSNDFTPPPLPPINLNDSGPIFPLAPPPPPPLHSAPSVVQPDFAFPPLPPMQEGQPIPKPGIPPAIRTDGPHMMLQPPTFNSQLTTGLMPQGEEEPSGAALSLPRVEASGPLLDREPLQSPSVSRPLTPSVDRPFIGSASLPPPPRVASPPAAQPASGGQPEPPLLAEESLASLERDVKSPHLDYIEAPVPSLPPPPSPVGVGFAGSSTADPKATPGVPPDDTREDNREENIEDARNAVDAALQSEKPSVDSPLEPILSLNAQPLGDPLHDGSQQGPLATPPTDPSSVQTDNGMPPPPPEPPPLMPPPPASK